MPKLPNIFRRVFTGFNGLKDYTKDLQLLRGSELFDEAWYRAEYPDVVSAGMDPALHYLQSGAAEGRNPSQAFDSKWYAGHYADVTASGKNPLIHYLEIGASGGRQIRPPNQPENAPPADQELLRRTQLIADSEFFDANWYRERYRALLVEDELDPALHFLTIGAEQGLHPSPKFDSKRYLQLHSDVAEAKLNPLLHYIEKGAGESRQIAALSVSDKFGVPTVDDLLSTKFDSAALLAFPQTSGARRLTLLVDGLNSPSLYEGRGTGLILAALLCERTGAALRLVTQGEQSDSTNFQQFLAGNGIRWQGSVEIVHSPQDDRREVPVSENDFFLVSSCRAARAVRAIAKASRIVYLVQDDERLQHPAGDEQLRCSEMLSDPGITFLVDSELLFEDLTIGPDKLANILERGTWLEPAFPRTQTFRTDRAPGEKRRIVVYASIDNPASLPWRAVEAIESAIEDNVLRLEEWEFCFAGISPLNVLLLGEIRPRLLSQLPYQEYKAAIENADMVLSLFHSPHPGYAVLNSAASGAPVITSRYGAKTSLARYSPNILCVEPSVHGITRAIAQAAASAPVPSMLETDWQTAFRLVLQQLEKVFQA